MPLRFGFFAEEFAESGHVFVQIVQIMVGTNLNVNRRCDFGQFRIIRSLPPTDKDDVGFESVKAFQIGFFDGADAGVVFVTGQVRSHDVIRDGHAGFDTQFVQNIEGTHVEYGDFFRIQRGSGRAQLVS